MADEFPNLEIAELIASDPEFEQALIDMEEGFDEAYDKMTNKAERYRQEIENA